MFSWLQCVLWLKMGDGWDLEVGRVRSLDVILDELGTTGDFKLWSDRI